MKGFNLIRAIAVVASALVTMATMVGAQPGLTNGPIEGDVILKDFKFKSGEVLPALNIHYTAIGKPQRDAAGRVTNAVLLLHGTGGSGKSLMRPIFTDVLFGRGQLLDTERYYVILPDGIGHGKSSKPSDGLRAKFPAHDYDDMVLAQKRMLEEGLGVNHLRLILGTSMGCMHAFVGGRHMLTAWMP